MTPTELREALARLSYTQRAFARRVGVSDRNVRRYCSEDVPVWVEHIIRLEEGMIPRRCDELRQTRQTTAA